MHLAAASSARRRSHGPGTSRQDASIMTVAFNGGASLALYELAKGMAMNTSFVWLPAHEGTFWGGTLNDLQKWLIKQQHTQQVVQKPQPVGTQPQGR